MYKPQRTTWFLVADGSRMRLFESKGVKEPWDMIDCQEADDARKFSREIGRERPGRGRKSGPNARYAMNGAEPHEKLENEFIGGLAGILNKAAEEDKFDQLVIAAPPKALGALRAKLQPQLTAKYIGVFDKDLTNISEKDLFEYFQERLVRW